MITSILHARYIITHNSNSICYLTVYECEHFVMKIDILIIPTGHK